MVAIRKDLVGSLRNTGGTGNTKNYITVHETDNWGRGADAAAHARLQKNGFAASWHWTVDDKEAVQSFPHNVICWHAGDGGRGTGNRQSIAIETCLHDGNNRSKTLRNLVDLIAYIAKSENIPVGNIVQHNKWSGKNCPSQIRKNDDWSWIISEVKKKLNGETNSTTITTKPATSTSSKLAIDGSFGRASVTRLQKVLGTVADGVISGQVASSKKYFPALVSVNFGSGGSSAIVALQRKLGVTADGFFGPITIKTWQRKLGVSADGFFGPASAKAAQRKLNDGRLF